jgi:hypothetical protein
VLKRLTLLTATLLALGLLLAACGGDDDDDDDDDDGTDETVVEGDDDSDETPAPTEAADDDDGDDDEVSGTDPCTLLTTEEVNELLGEAVDEPAPAQELGLFLNCSWFASAEGSFANVILQLLNDFPGGAQGYYDSVVNGLETGGDEFEEVSGLGDQAVYFAGLMLVREGDNAFTVSVNVTDGDAATSRARAEDAARLILERL